MNESAVAGRGLVRNGTLDAAESYTTFSPAIIIPTSSASALVASLEVPLMMVIGTLMAVVWFEMRLWWLTDV